jgi:hypothetical protein
VTPQQPPVNKRSAWTRCWEECAPFMDEGECGDLSMETNASPEYNIAHHTPNANRRACHRDPRGDDIRGQVIRICYGKAPARNCASRALTLRKIAAREIRR